MKYYVDCKKRPTGNGSQDAPFSTIQEAANVAVAGDEVIILPGVYEENVNPVNSGSESQPIIYRAGRKGTVTITGARRIIGWVPYEGNVWMIRIDNGFFGNYNPYTTYIQGDWYWADQPIHTGEVYMNNASFYEAQSLDDILSPRINYASWEPEQTVYQWFTCQDGPDTLIYANFQGADPNKENVEINVRQRCFFPLKEHVDYITVSGINMEKAATQWAPPTAFQDGLIGPNWAKGWIIEDCEISHSKCSGISLGKYLQKDNNNKWSTWGYKDGTQTERDAICQAFNEGWNKENIGSHIIRRCHIHHCGQTGIVGHLGGVFSTIEDNHIHNINNKQDLAGAEIGGIKMHAAIDCTYRHNHIHHCTRGLWLDWQAQGTRVTSNVFHDNYPPLGTQYWDDVLVIGEDIFIEVSHGPTLVDNNLLLSKAALRLPTQGCAIVHNFIAGSFTCVGKGTDNGAETLPSPRYTPYHVPHETAIAGFMSILHGDMRFYNNIFVQDDLREDLVRFALEKSNGEQQYICGTVPYSDYPSMEEFKTRMDSLKPMDSNDRDRYYDHLPVMTGGNVYFNGAKYSDKEKPIYENHQNHISWSLETTENELIFHTNLYEFLPDLSCDLIDTGKLGMAFEPEQFFENPDGSPINFDLDYFDEKAQDAILPGPFFSRKDKYIVK